MLIVEVSGRLIISAIIQLNLTIVYNRKQNSCVKFNSR